MTGLPVPPGRRGRRLGAPPPRAGSTPPTASPAGTAPRTPRYGPGSPATPGAAHSVGRSPMTAVHRLPDLARRRPDDLLRGRDGVFATPGGVTSGRASPGRPTGTCRRTAASGAVPPAAAAGAERAPRAHRRRHGSHCWNVDASQSRCGRSPRASATHSRPGCSASAVPRCASRWPSGPRGAACRTRRGRPAGRRGAGAAAGASTSRAVGLRPGRHAAAVFGAPRVAVTSATPHASTAAAVRVRVGAGRDPAAVRTEPPAIQPPSGSRPPAIAAAARAPGTPRSAASRSTIRPPGRRAASAGSEAECAERWNGGANGTARATVERAPHGGAFVRPSVAGVPACAVYVVRRGQARTARTSTSRPATARSRSPATAGACAPRRTGGCRGKDDSPRRSSRPRPPDRRRRRHHGRTGATLVDGGRRVLPRAATAGRRGCRWRAAGSFELPLYARRRC